MEDWDIARIIPTTPMRPSACRPLAWMGLELEAYGHLLDQFWSPATNTLDAPYGGALENRLRFTLEVLAAIRKRVGPDFIVRACAAWPTRCDPVA